MTGAVLWGVAALATWPVSLVAIHLVRRWRRRQELALIRKRFTEELRQEWEKAWQQDFARRRDEVFPPGEGAIVTPEVLRKMLRASIEDYEARGLIEPAAVRASFDPATNRITAEIPTTWEVIARMVAMRYAEGESHARVTAWLEEEIKQGFREVLVEVELADGSKRWALPGSIIEERVPV